MKASLLSGIRPEHARSMVYGAMGAAIVSAAITVWAGASGILGMSKFVFIDAAILVSLAVGVYRRSFACAVILLLYHVGNRAWMYFATGGLPGSLAFTLAVLYGLGIVGIVALADAPPKPPLKGPAGGSIHKASE